MNGRFDCIIIGAGVIGCAVARELSRFNLDIALIEKESDVSMGATKANSGIVHGGYAEHNTAMKGRLCYKGRTQFAQLQKELNFGFRKTGSLVIDFDDDISGLQKLMDNGIKNGLDDLSIIGHEQIMTMEPNLNSEVKWALYCEGAGVCSPYEYAIALAENAVENGVKLFLNHTLTHIEKHDNLFHLNCVVNQISGSCAETADACCSSESSFSAPWVINCSGINADKVSSMAGENYFTITPRTGEYILLARDTGKLLNTVVFQMPTKMGKGILVTSTYHGNLLIGPDASDEHDGDTSTHAERLKTIVHEARRTTDKFDMSKFIRSFTGVRAVASTNDFIVEETKTRGFINVAGIQSPGLTSSPAIAEMVRDILSSGGLTLEPKNNFNPYRTGIISRKELLPFSAISSLIDIPADPEKIICRCEQVRQKEIADALHRGIPVLTVDGVKRRTRAGMGFCQGTFCRPRVKALIESEYGVQISADDDVHHSGVNRVTRSDIAKLL